VAGCCEHGNEPLGFVKGRESLELIDCWHLRDSAPWSCLVRSAHSHSLNSLLDVS